MMNFARTTIISVVLASFPALAWPQANEPSGTQASPSTQPPATPPQATQPPAVQQQQQAQPPAQVPAPTPAPRATTAVPPGQWVYTEQYGWIWMPYSDAYTYAPATDSGEPYMYVYYPTVGWTWLIAPWVWGWGPTPYWGFYGPWHFAWYGHGVRPYAWRWGGPRPYWGWRGHAGWHGYAPAPYRGYVYRGGPAYRGPIYRGAPVAHVGRPAPGGHSMGHAVGNRR